MILNYNSHQEQSYISNPTVSDIERMFFELENLRGHHFGLRNNTLSFEVCLNIEFDRYLVLYREHDLQSPYFYRHCLVDVTLKNDTSAEYENPEDMLDFGSYNAGGDYILANLEQTVDVTEAYAALMHFAQHGTLPTSMMWEQFYGLD
jgi:hypothetical protein